MTPPISATLKPNGSCIGRSKSALLAFGLCILGLASTEALAEMDVYVGQPGPEDDYICWGRVPVEVTFDAGDALPSSVMLRSSSQNAAGPQGQIAFAPSRDIGAALQPTLEVQIDPLSRSGRAFVAGTAASVASKDVKIVATTADGEFTAERPLMVRVRKNADSLPEEERDVFLRAFRDAAQRNNQFAKYWGIHTDAIRMAHQVAFLPWHRVFLLNLERELQRENPVVALPYWEFDKPAPKLFSIDFLGRVGSLANPQEVEFGVGNPLRQFQLTDPRVAPLTRLRNGDTSASSGINKNFFAETEHGLMTSEIFGPYHGQAHVFIGGLVGDIRRSPADPLFFLLHANVDRAWAAWQRRYDRFDRDDPRAYGLQGAHMPGSGVVQGNFSMDTMWPWDDIVRPSEPITITIGKIMLPPTVGAGAGPSVNPEVGEMLDYLDLIGDGATHDYCYDTVPTGVGPVAGFP